MKNIKNKIVVGILAAAVLILIRAGAVMSDYGRVYIDGVEAELRGSALYIDPGTEKIEAEGDIAICLYGETDVREIAVHGRAYIYGDGVLNVSGTLKAGSLSVSDGAEVHAGRLRLIHRLEISPLYTADGGDILPPYKVSVKMDGHGDDGEILLRLGDSVPQPPDPQCEGYVFDGWYADGALIERFDFSLPRNEDTALYAGWIQIMYTDFDSWGGSEVARLETLWGARRIEPDAPEREGYTFGGWYADKRFTQQFDFSAPATEHTAAYAKWTKNAEAEVMGIDAARYQLDIDWKTVKASGVDFAIIRAGYRGYGDEGTLNTDEKFEENIAGAAAAGLDVGVYFFSQAVSEAEAVEEAEYVLELLHGRDLALPVFMDYELATDYDGNYTGRLYRAELSDGEYGAVCAAFCRRIEQDGYTAMVYGGTDMLRAVSDALEKEGCGAWLANWVIQTRYNGSYDYWQYSGGGTVKGIDPTVDLDIRYINPPGRVTGVHVDNGTLTWDKQPGAYGYMIFRASPGSGGYEPAGRTKGAAMTEFRDTQRPDGSSYIVCAYIMHGGIEYKGGFSDAAE